MKFYATSKVPFIALFLFFAFLLHNFQKKDISITSIRTEVFSESEVFPVSGFRFPIPTVNGGLNNNTQINTFRFKVNTSVSTIVLVFFFVCKTNVRFRNSVYWASSNYTSISFVLVLHFTLTQYLHIIRRKK